MRIGIAIDLDNNTLLPYFSERDGKLIKENLLSNSAVSVNTLILSFVKAGHYVRIFTKSKRSFKISTRSIEIYGVEYYDKYPIKYLWGNFLNGIRLRNTMKGNLSDLDVLHGHWTYDYGYAVSNFAKELPVFCTVRDWAPLIWRMVSLKDKITWCFKYLMNEMILCNKEINLIANSPYIGKLVGNKFQKEVNVIPNSIKDSFLRYDEKNRLNGIRLLCISSGLNKFKNIHGLVKAFQLLRMKFPEATLQLIGPPFVMENSIIQRWEKKGILKNVLLLGEISHRKIPDYIDKASIYVSPSIEESFGNTILESMARKVPVVGGQYSGAVPYVLHEGKAGFLCDIEDPQSICNTLKQVINNPIETSRIVSYAFEIVRIEYCEKTVCQRHIEIYNTKKKNGLYNS